MAQGLRGRSEKSVQWKKEGRRRILGRNQPSRSAMAIVTVVCEKGGDDGLSSVSGGVAVRVRGSPRDRTTLLLQGAPRRDCPAISLSPLVEAHQRMILASGTRERITRRPWARPTVHEVWETSCRFLPAPSDHPRPAAPARVLGWPLTTAAFRRVGLAHLGVSHATKGPAKLLTKTPEFS